MIFTDDQNELIGRKYHSLKEYFATKPNKKVGNYPSKGIHLSCLFKTPNTITTLNESDVISWKGKRYSWFDSGQVVFIVFKIDGKEIYAASVYGNDFTKTYYSNDPILEKHLRSVTSPEHIITHVELEREVGFFTETSTFNEILVSGRIFKTNDKQFPYIIGFWETTDMIKKHLPIIEKLLERLNLNLGSILWYSHYKSDIEPLPYNHFFSEEIKIDNEKKKKKIELLRQIHINDIIKKRILNLPPHTFQIFADKLGMTSIELKQLLGRDISEASLLNEVDFVYVNHKVYDWGDTQARYVFTIYDNFSIWVDNKNPHAPIFHSSNKELERLLNSYYSDKTEIKDKVGILNVKSHNSISICLKHLSKNFDINLDNKIMFHGRIFIIGNKVYVGMWQKMEKALKYPSHFQMVFDIIKKVGYDYKKVNYAFDGKGNKFYSLYDIVNPPSNTTKKLTSDKEIALRKALHTNDVLKRKVLKMSPNQLQLLADKMGITVAELKQIAGMDISENKKRSIEEIIQICEGLKVGDGFWLSPKGSFYDVLKKPYNGHVSFARDYLKNPKASYPDMFSRGFVWVGIFTTHIGINYTIPPTDYQMYLLKKKAIENNLKLLDYSKDQYIDTSVIQKSLSN